jgi:quinohemoprotein ethanol dehydrogenase
MQAFDATSGKRLWAYDVQTPVMAAPVTYKVGGQQYVAAVVGFGGGYGLSTPFFDDKRPKPNGRIMAFRLGGTASLPPFAPPPLRPANPPTEHFSAQRIAYGQRVYEGTCGYCHGAGGISAGVLPDLRRSTFLSSREAWDSVVVGGALKDSGMVSFSPWLPKDSIEAVRAFIAHRASQLRQEELVKP